MKRTARIALLLLPVVGLTAVVLLRTNKNGEPGTEDSSRGVITLKGATQFDESHAFTRTIRKFEELVKTYYGKPINSGPISRILRKLEKPSSRSLLAST